LAETDAPQKQKVQQSESLKERDIALSSNIRVAAMKFSNVYEDAKRAESYARLEFPGTYYLAHRDLPQIIFEYAKGEKALDFGGGTGRFTRFLKKLGFDAVGIDISKDMLKKAMEIDPEGDYRLVEDGDFGGFSDGTFDLALSAFTFGNIPTMGKKVKNFREIRRPLKSRGIMVNLVSSPEIYVH
jgi:ubiquinone/menaquinone biosynthesis C-methylase UbiE